MAFNGTGSAADTLLDALLGKSTCPPSCSCWNRYNSTSNLMAQMMGKPVPSNGSAHHSRSAPASGAHTTGGGSNRFEELEADDMPGPEDMNHDPPSPKLSPKKPTAAPTRPPAPATEDDDLPALFDVDDSPPPAQPPKSASKSTSSKPSKPTARPSEPAAKPSEPAAKPSEPAAKPSRPTTFADDDDMPPLVEIDDDDDDEKKGGADSDNESMPSLASMEDSGDEAYKPSKPAASKAPVDKKKKDDDSFDALMKRSGTIKRLSDIKENEERVRRAGGAGAEAKLKSLQAERERLEASLAPGVAAKLASKSTPAPSQKESYTAQAPKPKPPRDDFDDMPPLEDIADDLDTAPPSKPPSKPATAAGKEDDTVDGLMRRSNALKRLAEIKKEEESINRAGGAGVEAKKTRLRAEREELERSLSPADRTSTKPAPARETSKQTEKEDQDLDDMPPLEDIEDEPVPSSRATATSGTQSPTRPPSTKPKPAPKTTRKAPPRIPTPPPVAPKVPTPAPESSGPSSPPIEIPKPIVEVPPAPTLPPEAKPFDGLPKTAPPTYCMPHRCTGVVANEKEYDRLDTLLLEIFRAKFLLLLSNEYLPSLLVDVQAQVLEVVLMKTKSLDPSLPASRTLITSSIDHALGPSRLAQPTLQAKLGKLRMVEALHDTRCVLNLAALDRRAAAPAADLLDCRSSCVCELSTACDDLHLISLPLSAETTKRSSHGLVTPPLDFEHWEQWCSREVLSGRLKRPCWRSKWEGKIIAFLKAFQKAWNAVLASLDARAFVGGWVDLVEWLGGLRLWQEVERLEFDTVDKTMEGLDCWSELLIEAVESRRAGILLDRAWTDSLKIDGDVEFTMRGNRKATVKYALASFGDSSNVATRTNSGLARLKLGSQEDFRLAIADCTVALDADSTNTKALHRRGYAYSRLGLLYLAEQDLARCLALDPAYYPAEEELASVRERM